jgi:ABC-type antimicrobial peptide transport system permease subunit
LFYVTYVISELRRRKGRTLLTALGLGVGVGLVVTVSALSKGLDNAQGKVLKPLTGVGTDMSVSRPLEVSSKSSGPTFGGGPGGPRLSSSEQRQLEKENGGERFGLQRLGKAGEHFSNDRLVSTTQLSFAASEVSTVARLEGVQGAAGSLTLSNTHVSGTVPKQPVGGVRAAPGAAPGPPRSINFDSFTVTGIDQTKPSLAPVTPSQVRGGRYLSKSSGKYEALLNVSYARQKGYSLGDTVKVGGEKFTVVGLTSAPLGGSASAVYVKLSTLQQLSDREGRVNTIQVRATSSDQVRPLQKQIRQSFPGSQVITAKGLADRVGGSLVDAKNLSSKLGTALQIVGLAAAFLIASLLTLSSVAKRTRELGTLKALGWRQALVVRQVTGESLAQGLLGGVCGAAIGVAGAAIITAIGPTLKATVASASQGAGPFGLGQSQVSAGSTLVKLDAPIDFGLILLAIALALAGGLLSGAVGGLRASRLRPAEALRSVE